MWKIQRSLAWLLDSCTKVLGNKEELRMFFGVKAQQRNWMFFWYNNRGEKTQLGIYKAICRGHTIPPFCQRLEGTTLKDSTNSTPTFLWIPKSSMFSERKDTHDMCWGGFGGSPHWRWSSKDGVVWYQGIAGQYILENELFLNPKMEVWFRWFFLSN